MDATGLASGTVYPILRRLARKRLVRSDWHNQNAADHVLSRRRYYELTGEGEKVLAEAVERYRALQNAFAAGSGKRTLEPGNG